MHRDSKILIAHGGERVIVDADIRPELLALAWYVRRTDGYAMRQQCGQNILLHRVIAMALPGEVVDHINCNRLDCRRSNLRIVSRSTNLRNRKNVVGATWSKSNRRWVAALKINYRRIHLGNFKSKRAAMGAYRAACRHYFPDAIPYVARTTKERA